MLVELGRAEDPEALADVAREWARSEKMDTTPDVTQPIVADLVELAANASHDGLSVYLWVQPA